MCFLSVNGEEGIKNPPWIFELNLDSRVCVSLKKKLTKTKDKVS